MENDEMRALADALWAYFRVKYLKDLLAGNVSFYTATVTSAPTDGEIDVQRPYDAPVTLRYAWTASSLQVGDKCTVLVFGDPSNAFVIGNGTLSDGGGGDLSDYLRIDDLAGTTGSSQTTAMTQAAVTTLAGDLQTATNDVAANAQNAIAIVADGDTHIAVSAGQYVYVKNHGTLTEGLYKATTDIAANAALSSSNLTAATNGGLNDILSGIDRNSITGSASIVSLSSYTSQANPYTCEMDGYARVTAAGDSIYFCVPGGGSVTLLVGSGNQKSVFVRKGTQLYTNGGTTERFIPLNTKI